ATSLDGRVAAPDGTSQWITGLAARAHVHKMRSQVDAIAVGMGTVMADDPALTARQPDGSLTPSHQPLRVAIGLRPIPHGAAMQGPGGPTLHLATRDPAEAIEALAKREIRHVLLEGGARLASAWLGAEVVDRILTYVAPVALGSGQTALVGFGVESLDQAARFVTRQVTQLGQDVLIDVRRD
ncbi:MAG: RibD family protein, partial [Micrococcales bacterium]|nr:RibD family protein [Micrococcales bacterium]